MLNCFGDCNDTASVFAFGGTPGYTYKWEKKFPNIAIGFTQTITGLCAGQYGVTVTDANNCWADTSFTISQPTQLTIKHYSKTDINCFTDGDIGQIVIDTVTGGTAPYVYTIHCSVGPYVSGNSFTNLPPGNYNLGIMDSHGCKSSCTAVSINRPSDISINFSPVLNPTGFGLCNGSITSTASGGTPPFTHYWFKIPNTVPFSTQTSQPSTVSNLCIGTYCDSVVDSHHCFKKKCDTIVEPAELIISVDSSNISCFGKQDGWICITITGGVAPYQIHWSPNNQTSACISGLPAGYYTVLVTDANLNVKTRTVHIIEPGQILINFTHNTVCFGQTNGWVDATPSQGTPPYSYHWNNGMTTHLITGLTPDLWYIDTVYDSRGCKAYDSAFIPENPHLFVTINNTDSSVCKGNCIQMNVDAYGGTFPYSFSWTPGAGVSDPTVLQPEICPVTASLYTIHVTDTKGCSVSAGIYLSIDSLPKAVFSYSNLCQSREVHFTDESLGNGTIISEWLWDFGDGSFSTDQNPVHIYTGLAGWYNVSLTVTNYQGCSDYTMKNILIDPVIQVDFSADTVCLQNYTTLTGFSLNPSTLISYWKWYLDDVDTVVMYPPQHTIHYTFTSSGFHSVKLELNDTSGCTGWIIKQVFVRSIPQPDFFLHLELYQRHCSLY